MTVTTLKPTQKVIPFHNYILPVILSKKECCNLLGCSAKTLRRRYVNEAFFQSVGEDWEDVKNLSYLSPAATECFFILYPQTIAYFVRSYVKENIGDRRLVELVVRGRVVPI